MQLPKPTTIAEQYLAAILAELQTLNTTMHNLAKRSSSAKSADKPESKPK